MLQRQPTLTWKISLLNDDDYDDDDDDDDENDIDDKNYNQMYLPNNKKVKNALAKVNISNLQKESDVF